MRASLFVILVITAALSLPAGCGEPGTTGERSVLSEPTATATPGTTWGEAIPYLRPIKASIPWREWTIRLNEWGNFAERRIIKNNIKEEELDEIAALTKIAARNPHEAHLHPTLFTLSTASDMVRLDHDGTRYLESGSMNISDKRFAEESYANYMRAAYAYSRGNLKIAYMRKDPYEPFLGEYRGTTFYYPDRDLDLGSGLDPLTICSLNAIWYPGPVTPWSRGATMGTSRWAYSCGMSSNQFAPGREGGGPFSDLGIVVLHEWLHQMVGLIGLLGYTGLPSQYAVGNMHGAAHLYYQHFIITPRMWRSTQPGRMIRQAAPNRPKNRHASYITDWLLCGEFEGADPEAITDDPVHSAWTSIQVQGRALTPEELRFPESEAHLLPDEGDDLMGKTWFRYEPVHDPYTRHAESYELDLVYLRLSGKGAFVFPRKNVYIYAATYVWSPKEQHATIWATGETPYQLYVNAEECLRSGIGTSIDNAWRDIHLRQGWNRILIQKMDQGEGALGFGVQITDRERNHIPALKISAAKPEGLDEAALLRVDPNELCVPPIAIKYYSWEGDVADDWWGVLPILDEQDFEAILGQKGVRIDGNRRDQNLFIDVSEIQGIRSRVVTKPGPSDALLNNLLEKRHETTALIRYTHPETGKPRDLLFVRIDMVEPFIELVKVADPRPLKDSLIGYILRGTKQAVVFETDLGEPMPANEVSLVGVRDEDIFLRAWPSVPRVVRGQPLTLNVEATYDKGRGEGVPELENVTLKLVEQVRAETADTEIFRNERSESVPWLKPGMALTMDTQVETKDLAAGVATFIASVTYTKDGTTHTVTKPVPIPVFDPVDVTLNIDGSSLLAKPSATATVIVHNNLDERARGTVRLALPEGWKASPAKQSFKLDQQDDETQLEFELTLPPNAASTSYVLRAHADVGAARGITSEGVHQVQVALSDALIYESFDHTIPSDLGYSRKGAYKVNLGMREVDMVRIIIEHPPAYKGSACLKIQDGGGSRYGYVNIFGIDRFWPAGPYKPNTSYSYDTNDFPVVEWWMRSDAGDDANLGLNVTLETDHGPRNLGVLLHGVWQQQWDPARKIGEVDFIADNRWHRITINLDKLLDDYLGNETHLIKDMRFGDTRRAASTAWGDPHRYTHFIDELSIRKLRPDEHYEQPKAMTWPEGLVIPPAFSSTPSNGFQLTTRPEEVAFSQGDRIILNCWLSNMSETTLNMPVTRSMPQGAIRLVDENGADVFDDQPGGWLSLSPPVAGPQPKPQLNQFLELKPGESALWTPGTRGRIQIQQALTGYFKQRTGSHEIPAGTYELTYRLTQQEWDADELGPPTWQGEVTSNTTTFVIKPAPTQEELLAQLKSNKARRRAQAVAALYLNNHFDALPAIVASLDDPDADVRLNAVVGLGELARGHYRPAFQSVQRKFANADLRDEAARELAELQATWDPIVARLVQALDDENWRIGEYACFALAKIGDLRGIKPIVSRLASDSPWMRRQAARALGEYWLHMPPDPEDTAGREAASQAAAYILKHLLDATGNELIATRLFSYRAARRLIGKPLGGGEGETITAEDFDPFIHKAFSDPYWEIQVDAASWAVKRPQTNFDAELAAQMTSHHFSVRNRLPASLAQLANARAALAVAKAREENSELTDEEAAAIALEAKQPYIDGLMTMLHDRRITVRWAAVTALRSLDTGKTVEELTGHDEHYWRCLTN